MEAKSLSLSLNSGFSEADNETEGGLGDIFAPGRGHCAHSTCVGRVCGRGKRPMERGPLARGKWIRPGSGV